VPISRGKGREKKISSQGKSSAVSVEASIQISPPHRGGRRRFRGGEWGDVLTEGGERLALSSLVGIDWFWLGKEGRGLYGKGCDFFKLGKRKVIAFQKGILPQRQKRRRHAEVGGGRGFLTRQGRHL